MTKVELWLHEVKLKHLPIVDTTPETLQASMNIIADAVDRLKPFKEFDTSEFRNISEGDCWPLLNRLFDFADEHLIHII